MPNAAEERKEKAQPMDKRTIFGKPALRFRDKYVFPVTIKGVLRFSPPTPFVFKKAYFKKRNCSSNTVHGMEMIHAEMDLRHLKSLIF